ncbi:MAG: GGDEF domain-containing protein [Rhizobiales bacterium]|nr:GGDEF domain-containing protein [Hyphomicrobiales bacterium]
MTEESGMTLPTASGEDAECVNVTLIPQDPDSVALAIAAAGDVTYHWDLKSDALSWGLGADTVLRRPPECLINGKQFAALLDPENLASRYDAIMNGAGEDSGTGVPYHIEYQLRADSALGVAAMWIEDRGRWFAGEDGRPAQAVGIVRPVDERHSRDQMLSALSHTDPLTGMMNRTRLDEALEEAIGQARSSETSCAFAVAAIRNLDVVNEAYGFEVADEVIAALSHRLRGVTRTGDGIARYSGSKFGFILNNCSGADLPVAIERFLNVARDSVIETSHGPVWALLSVGAVLLPVHAESGVAARAHAEEALSAALRLSSDSFVVHLPSEKVNTSRMVNARCAAEIVECLRSNKFHLAFQPLIDAQSGQVACHEALLRMRDTSGEVVTAGHLVPVAERLGLIRLVDRAVVQMALETLHRHEGASLSINLSATTANDPRWNAQIIEMIEMAGEVAKRLTIEITETTALTDLTSALAFLERLRTTGCCVAIDDFGAGFTSFRNLRDLPIDVIKLDGSYCRNLVKDPENVYFARTLIEMAHHFGIRTVAEWVETESDAEILKSLGIDFLQGNYLGLPDSEAPWTETSAAAFTFFDGPQPGLRGKDRRDDTAEDAGDNTGPISGEVIGDVGNQGHGSDVDAAPEPDQVDEITEDILMELAAQILPAEHGPDAADTADTAGEPAAGTEGPAAATPPQSVAAASGAPGPAAHDEITALEDEVDGSLARLKAALDLLSREIEAPDAVGSAGNENGEDVRLAG